MRYDFENESFFLTDRSSIPKWPIFEVIVFRVTHFLEICRFTFLKDHCPKNYQNPLLFRRRF